MVSDFPSFDVAALEVRVRFEPTPDHALSLVALLVVLILEAGMLDVRMLFGDVQFALFICFEHAIFLLYSVFAMHRLQVIAFAVSVVALVGAQAPHCSRRGPTLVPRS